MDKDKEFLKRAIGIAKISINEGGGPFGALIVKNGTMISSSGNKVVKTNDPTAHAEVLAIREASRILGTFDLSDCILYTSCEPCPMCLGAIYWARIPVVVYASDRKDAAMAGFDDELIYREVSVKPSERKIKFRLVEDPGAAEVFRSWKTSVNKTTY